jgi:D-alanyl-lipoteichoic acid acyltransferase DltB (MBOAT superfamily)
VTFFPQLVAGPVLRASEVVGQLVEDKRFHLDMLLSGSKRIIYGLFLKVVLADNIAPLVNDGFLIAPSLYGGLDVWSLAFLFGLQIYFDFAGYSHIAIGCARLMGINFPENFDFPYAAKSFRDFWKRWHISLSSWIRDYLYLPLTGTQVINKLSTSEGGLTPVLGTSEKRRSKTQALFLTWGIMGLWHGANWTFVCWGLFHATMIYCERRLQQLWKRLKISWHPRLGWAITMPIAMLGWIPFRAQNLTDTLEMFEKIFRPTTYLQLAMRENVYLITALIMTSVIVAYDLDRIAKKAGWESSRLFAPFNVIKYTSMIVLIYIFFRPISQFIYFQF